MRTEGIRPGQDYTEVRLELTGTSEQRSLGVRAREAWGPDAFVPLATFKGLPPGFYTLRCTLRGGSASLGQRLVFHLRERRRVTCAFSLACLRGELQCPPEANPEATECTPWGCLDPWCLGDPDCVAERFGADAGVDADTPLDAAAVDAAGAPDASGDGRRDTTCERGCDDGNPCTADRCEGGRCVHEPTPGVACDNGVFCDGPDRCDATGACVPTGEAPCPSDRLCDEVGDRCVECRSRDDCPPDDPGTWSSCEANGTAGDAFCQGRQRRTRTTYSCDVERGVCVSRTATQTRECTLHNGYACYWPDPCDDWGSCTSSGGGYCDTAGTRTRTCRRYECRSGSCSLVRTYTQEESCTLPPPCPSWCRCDPSREACVPRDPSSPPCPS